MKRFVFALLALIFALSFVGCFSDKKQNSYNSGSLEGFSNETVSKDDKLLALNRLILTFHMELLESEFNSLKTKDSQSEKNDIATSFVCEVKMIGVDEQGNESNAGTVLNKYDADKDVFYADRTDVSQEGSVHKEEWYYYENGHRYYVVKEDNNQATKIESDDYGNYEYIYQQIFQGIEKSLDFNNPDGDNFYVNYRYNGEGEGSEYYKPEEDTSKPNNLNWVQKVGFVQSFVKAVRMDVYSNSKCYNKLILDFKEYGTDVNIPEIPDSV